jgi:hypothetical protein
VVVAVTAVLVMVGAGAYVAGRAHRLDHPPAESVTGTSPDISWATVGPWPVPRSVTAGPAQVSDGVGTGYAHTGLGAAMAAWNIGEQMSSDAGPATYTATVRDQTYGDADTMLALIAQSPTGGSAPGSAFFYTIDYGDPTGDDPVLVYTAERTPSSQREGGYYGAYRTLRWMNGDWRMQVPVTGSQLITDVSGLHALGGPGV